jgi:hypothetical protein
MKALAITALTFWASYCLMTVGWGLQVHNWWALISCWLILILLGALAELKL